jgi:copper resistance protein D
MEETKVLRHGQPTWLLLGVAGLWVCFFLFMFVWRAPQNSSHGDHHEHMSMPMVHEMSPAQQTKLLADKKESEFNHHVAGFFVALAGILVMLQPNLAKRWPAVKYALPTCFLISGVLVLIWSDTELWPFGHREWLEALRHNREVLQHKLFAILLLGLGLTEWQRARGVLKAFWSGWVFPVLAIGGSFLLLFHQHEAGMHGANHVEVMERIQSEHLSYAVAGIGIGLAKGMAEVKSGLQGVFSKAWPALMIVLGVSLMFYLE